VPWKEVLRYAPQMIDRTEQLVEFLRANRARRVDAEADEPDAAVTELLAKLDAIEQNIVAQAELLSQAAAQQERLSQALRILSTRVTIALWLSGAALVAAVVAIAIAAR
jgi:hypothetical protein